jgi:hypothetical protein
MSDDNDLSLPTELDFTWGEMQQTLEEIASICDNSDSADVSDRSVQKLIREKCDKLDELATKADGLKKEAGVGTVVARPNVVLDASIERLKAAGDKLAELYGHGLVTDEGGDALDEWHDAASEL